MKISTKPRGWVVDMTASLVSYGGLHKHILLVNDRVWVSLLSEKILSKAHNATSETTSSKTVLEALLDFILFNNLSDLNKFPESKIIPNFRVQN